MRLRFRTPDLVCQQMVELVTEYLEGALTARDTKRFERHLAACVGCAAYLEQMRTTIKAAGQIVPADLDDDAVTARLDAYEAFLGEQDPVEGRESPE